MIILSYATGHPQAEDWIERMKDLALAYRLEIDETRKQPRLEHGAAEYVGVRNITDYLDQLYAERELWWYCVCDRGE